MYRQLTTFPSILSARICNNRVPGHVKVHSRWTQRDLERKEKTKFLRSHVVQLDVVFNTSPCEINNV